MRRSSSGFDLAGFFQKLLDDQFYLALTASITYFCRQQNLISEMKSQAKKLQDTCWESTRRTILWFKAHRIGVLENVHNKRPSCAPSMSWWIVLMSVENILSVSSITAKTLLGQINLVSQHREALEKLVSILTDSFGVQHVSNSEREALRDDKNLIVSDNGRFDVSVESLCGFLDNIGTFVFDRVKVLEAKGLQYLLLDLSRITLKLICGIGSIYDERDSRNEAGAGLPTVISHELVKLRGRDFRIIIRNHRKHLLTS